MEDEGVLTLKSVEPALARFNEDAVPHHVRLLKIHHQHIREFSEAGDWSRVKAEQTNARRVAGQLRALLDDLAQLRQRVRVSDRAAFDSRTASAREQTKRAIKLCLEVAASGCAALARATAPVSSLAIHHPTTLKTDVGSEEIHEPAERTESPLEEKQLLEIRASELESQEAALAGWRGLQAEVALVAEAWRTLAVEARRQREPVEAAAQSIERAGEEVGLARKALAQAVRWSGVSVCAAGAAAGALVGGPLGLLVGAKAAAASALAGSLLGYSGASAIVRRTHIDHSKIQ